MTKKENPGMTEINRKPFSIKNHPLLTVTTTRNLLKKLQIWYLSTILASKTTRTIFKFYCQVHLDNFGQGSLRTSLL